MIEPYYKDEQATIYCGDCREILPTLGRFDLLLTDPPYGIGIANQPTKWQREAGQEKESWDDMTCDYGVCVAVKQTESQIVWGGNYCDIAIQRLRQKVLF